MPTAKQPRQHKLDDIDYLLLSILQQDCTQKPEQLSEALKAQSNGKHAIGAAACRNRIDTLEEHGFISRYCAILNPNMFKRDQVSFMLVRAAVRSEEALERFIKSARADESVLELHAVSGSCDYVLKVRVANAAEAQKLSKKLGVDVASIESLTGGETYKETTAIKLR